MIGRAPCSVHSGSHSDHPAFVGSLTVPLLEFSTDLLDKNPRDFWLLAKEGF